MTEWKPPTFMEKITGFTITMAQWAADGFPRRSPEWIAEIFEICKGCDYYDPELETPFAKIGKCPKGGCSRCECHISDDPENMLNKIVLPNTACPEGFWHASIEIEGADVPPPEPPKEI